MAVGVSIAAYIPFLGSQKVRFGCVRGGVLAAVIWTAQFFGPGVVAEKKGPYQADLAVFPLVPLQKLGAIELRS